MIDIFWFVSGLWLVTGILLWLVPKPSRAKLNLPRILGSQGNVRWSKPSRGVESDNTVSK